MVRIRPALKYLVFFAAGVIFQTYFPYFSFFSFIGISLIITVLTIVLRKNTQCLLFLIPFLLFTAGAGRVIFLQVDYGNPNQLHNSILLNKPVQMQGTVTEKTSYYSGVMQLYIEPDTIIYRGVKYYNTAGLTNVILSDSLDINVGDRFTSRGRIMLPSGQRNPGGFDERTFLRNRGVFTEFKIPAGMPIEVSSGESGFSISGLIRYGLGDKLAEIFADNHEGKYLEFMKAVVLGSRSGLEPEIVEGFKNAGTIHLLAVSGLHVGFMIMFINFFFYHSGYSKTVTVRTVIIILILFYIILTGAKPPVMRAGIFSIIFILGYIWQKRRDNLNILASAAMVILLIDPNELFDVGFQLSFSAVAGILLASKFTFYVSDKDLKGKNLFGNWSDWGDWLDSINWKKLNILYYIAGLLVMSIGASWGTAPAAAYYFQRIVPGSILLNVAAIPLSALIVGFGLMELLLSGFAFLLGGAELGGLGFGSGLGGITDYFIDILFKLNTIAEYIPLYDVNIGSEEYAIFITIFVVVSASLFILRDHRDTKTYLAISSVLIAVVFWSLIGQIGLIGSGSIGSAEIVFFDVGQGDAVFIRTENDKKYLVDTGGNVNGTFIAERTIMQYIHWKNITHLDGIFISHNEKDHTGGLEAILSKIECDTVYIAKDKAFEEDIAGLSNIRSKPSWNVKTLRTSDKIHVGGNTSFEVLYPTSAQADSAENTNERSLVMRFTYGDNTALFTGDIGIGTEETIINSGIDLSAEILKVAHHGSKYSTGAEFLGAVKPAFAVIQAGRGNIHGHPAPETLKRLNDSNTKVYRTDQQGAVIFKLDGKKIELVDWRK